MQSPLHFLVVIPTYNGETYLRETLASLRAQTHEHWNAVIVDDASTDASVSMAEEFSRLDPRIHTLALEKNHGGPAIPRNRAIVYAIERRLPFDLVSFLDGDDQWEVDKLRTDADAFSRDSSLGMVYARHVFHLEGATRKKVDLPAIRSVRDLAWNNTIYCSSVTLARSVVDQFSPLFDEDPLLRATEDTELWFRLLSSGVSSAGTRGRHTVYRLRESSISHVHRVEALRRLVYLYAKAASKNKNIPATTFYVPLAYRAFRRWIGCCLFSFWGHDRIR